MHTLWPAKGKITNETTLNMASQLSQTGNVYQAPKKKTPPDVKSKQSLYSHLPLVNENIFKVIFPIFLDSKKVLFKQLLFLWYRDAN